MKGECESNFFICIHIIEKAKIINNKTCNKVNAIK